MMVYYFVFVLVYSFFFRSFSCNVSLAIVKKINIVETTLYPNTDESYPTTHKQIFEQKFKTPTHKNKKKQKAFAQIRPINKYIVFIFISINIVFIIAISQNGLLVARISQATVVNLLSSSVCIPLQLHHSYCCCCCICVEQRLHSTWKSRFFFIHTKTKTHLLGSTVSIRFSIKFTIFSLFYLSRKCVFDMPTVFQN